MLVHRARRIIELFTSPTYRRVLLCRAYCYLLHKLQPDLRYVGLVRGGETTFLFLRDNVVTPYTVAAGDFQRGDLRRVIELCRQIGAPLGGVFLDLGANVGTTTLYALRSGEFARALCVEPAPSNLTLLRLNMEANGFADRALVRAGAVSDRRGTLRLALSADNCGDHRVASNPSAPAGDGVDVEVLPVDELLREQGVAPESVSFVWVDTQGHEGYVLEGARSLLDRGVPFCIEFWPQALQEAGCYERLLALIEREFESFFDLSADAGAAAAPAPAASIRTFARRFEGTIYHTDLFLVPRRERRERRG